MFLCVDRYAHCVLKMIKIITALKPAKYLALLGLLLVLSGCQPRPGDVNMHVGQTMGTQYSVQWIGGNTSDKKKLVLKFERRLFEINQAVSTYIEDSELSIFNHLPAGQEMAISEDFARIIGNALEIAALTQGAFDFTVAALVDLWGFGPSGAMTGQADQATIREALARVAYQNISLDKNTSILRKHAQSEIDLSAIAKGDAVDALAVILEEQGYNNYLVEIGGELRARGNKADGSAWRVGIETPLDQGRSINRVLVLDDISVATSGDYRNYFEQDGVRYSHTINPATGYPVTHALASVTVLDTSCGRADALATALMVMGPEKGMEFAGKHALAAYFLTRDGDGFVEKWSLEFERYLPDQ